MPYAQRHKLLTIHGKLFSSSAETWTMGLRFNPGTTDTVSQAQVDACLPIVANWWDSSPVGFSQYHTLEYCKLAPIGVDGKYPPGEDSVISNNAALPGSMPAGNNMYPAQCSLAVSLMTNATRGLAWSGRIYPPAPQVPLGAAGQVTAADAASFAQLAADMIGALNDVPNLGLAYVFGYSKKTGFTAARQVTSVRVGRVIDTQRRRRSSLVEGYQSKPVV